MDEAIKPAGQAIRRLTTVVAADICGYSRLAEADEAAAVKTVELVFAVFEKVVTARRGRIFYRAGDGFLAEFPSAADGVLAAIEFTEDVKSRDTLAPNSLPAKVRVGVHVGDVTEQPGGDLLGHGVNVAARLQSEAPPGGVLVSLHTVNLVRGKIEAQFHRRGPLSLKNIDEPVVAFDVVKRSSGVSTLSRMLRPFLRIRPATFGIAVLGVLVLVINLALLDGMFRGGSFSLGPSERETDAVADYSKLVSAPNPETSYSSYFDSLYIYRILHDLSQSGHAADQAILNLLERGSIEKAISELNKTLGTKNLTKEDRLRILHQIGVISYGADYEAAISAYNRILEIDPNDVWAHIRLGYIYSLTTEVEKSDRHYRQALEIGTADKRLELELRENVGFNYYLNGDRVSAIETLGEVVREAGAINAGDLEVRARASLGMAYMRQAEAFAREGPEEESLSSMLNAKTHLLSVYYDKHDDTKFAIQRARAGTALGDIARHEGDLTQAIRYYETAYEIETKTKRMHTVADALIGLGKSWVARYDAFVAKGDEREAETALATAKSDFEEALEISRREFLLNYHFRSLLGLAQVAARLGDNKGRCARVSEAEDLFRANNKSYNEINPEDRGIIEILGCDFSLL